MICGYCAGPFKEFSEDELYERYLRIQAEKKKIAEGNRSSDNQKMICGYCPGPKQITYEEFCTFIEKREAENKQQTAATARNRK